MSLSLVIEEHAATEISEANNWYLQKSVLAADNFQANLKVSFNVLIGNFIEHREVIPGVRVLSLAIFPYNIYYRKLHEQVQIIAVLHIKRNTNFVRKRLRND